MIIGPQERFTTRNDGTMPTEDSNRAKIYLVGKLFDIFECDIQEWRGFVERDAHQADAPLLKLKDVGKVGLLYQPADFICRQKDGRDEVIHTEFGKSLSLGF